ncbi:N-acyl-D-amino-acid deacylase family protein [Polyangium sorediatum]|uniref:Amidohydrolase family protein n=1 Tax=Polyangium sorediatum TaxID=889274 RepID=A0ABT6NJ11_9BACT|nr:amidohydrolase family protein [Polyangium sorediatum]MDI1428305.1 amidohydrolase family protein [Polyangium sorediatum]
MYDVKIVGGTLVDGTGAPRQSGDIGIKDGKIVDVGDCPESAARTISAQGALVIPGFVDIHTHYDGQISWDEELAPSSIHGVTTCVMGNCGVGFAPVRPSDHEKLIELMEGVEDIPGSALAEGLTWGWESFPEYMDVLEKRRRTIDFICQVPHDALRVYVMGERAVAEESATESDVESMRALLREALLAGAAGFSTGRTDNHRSAQGKPTPASEARGDELAGIARAFTGLPHGVVQAVSDFDMFRGEESFPGEFDLLERMAEVSGRPLSVSTMQRDHAPRQWERIFERAERAARAGMDIRCQVAARPIGVLLGLTATFHPFMGFPSYREIASLPLDARVAQMRDPSFRARLLSEKSGKVAGDGSPLPPLADFFLANPLLVAMRLFRLGEAPNYEPSGLTSLAGDASRGGLPLLSVIYDAMLEQDGRALLYFPLYNYTEMNLDVVRRMLLHPLSLPGLGDGGAHVGTICDASFPTFLLTHWGRDRAEGKIPVEHLVKMQTHDTARFLGLDDRGTLKPGQRADINIVDFDNLRLRSPFMQRDLPAGGQRLMQQAEGYVATLVAGEVIVEKGRFTGARPGRLVRMGKGRG